MVTAPGGDQLPVCVVVRRRLGRGRWPGGRTGPRRDPRGGSAGRRDHPGDRRRSRARRDRGSLLRPRAPGAAGHRGPAADRAGRPAVVAAGVVASSRELPELPPLLRRRVARGGPGRGPRRVRRHPSRAHRPHPRGVGGRPAHRPPRRAGRPRAATCAASPPRPTTPGSSSRRSSRATSGCPPTGRAPAPRGTTCSGGSAPCSSTRPGRAVDRPAGPGQRRPAHPRGGRRPRPSSRRVHGAGPRGAAAGPPRRRSAAPSSPLRPPAARWSAPWSPFSSGSTATARTSYPGEGVGPGRAARRGRRGRPRARAPLRDDHPTLDVLRDLVLGRVSAAVGRRPVSRSTTSSSGSSRRVDP